MNIQSAEFVKGIKGTDPILFDGKFQVAFVGRSNVGKSSLISSLATKEGLARSSSNPGRTIRLDFFLINKSFYFVDLPGYGYARVSEEKSESIRKMILWYLMYSGVTERVVILVLDAKAGITPFDKITIDIFHEQRIKHIIVANKVDNLKMKDRKKQLATIRADAGKSLVIPYSSDKHIGKNELKNAIERLMNPV